jgi:Sulfotransferase family
VKIGLDAQIRETAGNVSDKPICAVILSTKSAGSSALQSLVCECTDGRHVVYTRHAQHETLYWTKAASILGRKQIRIPDSEVPIAPQMALHDLRALLTANLPGFELPPDSGELIFEGWRQLCVRFGPLFVEKSPHHLHQWAALELLIEAVHRLPEIDFRFVALVRNPMDVLYSMWRLWRADPAKHQHQWRLAYENLRRFQREVASPLLVVRYEDLAAHGNAAGQLIEFLDRPASPAANSYMHAKSLQRWKVDRWFGFQLDGEVERLATSFGYTSADLRNQSFPLWEPYRILSHLGPRSLSRSWRVLRRHVRNNLLPGAQARAKE